ncbi:hypothetical protein ACFX13_044325 [Malus domestica]
MCLTDAANYIREGCPNHKEAIGWQNDCMLRYSNRSIYGMMQTNPALYLKNDGNVSTGLDAFSQERSHLLNRLAQKTATGGDLRKFATGKRKHSNASIGVRIVTPSCGLRYENYTFFYDTTETPTANTAIPGGITSWHHFSI